MLIYHQREQVRQLVSDGSAADAPTAYYALFHDPARSELFVSVDEQGQTVGFVGRFQTGLDLFRPLVTLHCSDATIANDLLAEALTPGRPHILFAAAEQLPLIQHCLDIFDIRVLRVCCLSVSRFKPVVNVLVQHSRTPDGLPRCVIESGGYKAVAGVNWQSPAFAEIYVHTDPPVRQRGWGSGVASAVTQAVLESSRLPLYLVEQQNDVSRQLADTLGYVDTGARQVYADVVYQG